MRLPLLCSSLEQIDGVSLGAARVVARFKQDGQMAQRDHVAAGVCVLIGPFCTIQGAAALSCVQFGIGKTLVVCAPEIEQKARRELVLFCGLETGGNCVVGNDLLEWKTGYSCRAIAIEIGRRKQIALVDVPDRDRG